MERYAKLIGGVIGGLIPIIADAGLDVAWLTQEVVGWASFGLSMLLVYLLPNKV